MPVLPVLIGAGSLIWLAFMAKSADQRNVFIPPPPPPPAPKPKPVIVPKPAPIAPAPSTVTPSSPQQPSPFAPQPVSPQAMKAQFNGTHRFELKSNEDDEIVNADVYYAIRDTLEGIFTANGWTVESISPEAGSAVGKTVNQLSWSVMALPSASAKGPNTMFGGTVWQCTGFYDQFGKAEAW